MLAAINPSNCFVYDSRIHQPLRLFWSLYRPNESYPLLTGVAQGRENSRSEKLRIKLDSLNVAPLKRAAKGLKQSLIIESYCAYCCFIKELSRLTIEESAKSNKIGWTDTDIFAENKKSIYLQLTEMGLFALLGRGKGNPGFLRKVKKALDDKLIKFQ